MDEIYAEEYQGRRIQILDDGQERHSLVDGEEYDLPELWGRGDLDSHLILLHGEIDAGRL